VGRKRSGENQSVSTSVKTDRTKKGNHPISNWNDRANRGTHGILIAIAGFPNEIVLSSNQNRDVFYRNKGIHWAIADPCDRKDTAMLLNYLDGKPTNPKSTIDL
jgi:hypothetical protein